MITFGFFPRLQAPNIVIIHGVKKVDLEPSAAASVDKQWQTCKCIQDRMEVKLANDYMCSSSQADGKALSTRVATGDR